MWAKHKQHPAFTIVELLIVIVVIGILATITIVAYNGIQNRARVSSANSALNQTAKKIAIWQVDNPGLSPPDLASAGVTNSGGVIYQYTQTGSGTTYCVTASVGSVSYKIDSSTSSTAPVQGVCAGHTADGYVTNLSQNPSAETSLSKYSGPNGSTLTLSSIRANSGTSSVLATLPTQTASTVGINTSGGYNVPTDFKASTTYAFSVWVYVMSGTVDVALSAQGSGLATSNCFNSSTAIKDSWVRLSCTFTTGTTGTIALYVLNKVASTSGMQFYVDSMLFTEGTTIYNYADGNTASWTWNGAANSSTSTGPPA